MLRSSTSGAVALFPWWHCRDIGVDAESVSFGRNATAMLPFTGFTEEQEKMIDRLTEQTYDGFLEKVGSQMAKSFKVFSHEARIWSDIALT